MAASAALGRKLPPRLAEEPPSPSGPAPTNGADAEGSGSSQSKRPGSAPLLSAEKRAELAETALQRSEVGRVRLRSALAEQRADAEARILEIDRQLLATQKQLREVEGGPGSGALSEAQMSQLREQIEAALVGSEHKATEKELEAHAAMLGSAHTFQVQQQRFHDRLQAELTAMHRKNEQRDAAEQALQARLQDLDAQLRSAKAAAAGGAGGAVPTAAGAPAAMAGVSAAAAAKAAEEPGVIGSLIGFGIFGDKISKAEQLPALQASFKSAMEELGRQTAANQALRSELRAAREAATNRQRSSHLMPGTDAASAASAAGAGAGAGTAEGGGAVMSAEDAMEVKAAIAAERKALEEACAGFDAVIATLGEAKSQRKEGQRVLSDILWQLRRRNPGEDLEAKATANELARLAEAIERQQAAETALQEVATSHARELSAAKKEAEQSKNRAFVAEAAVKSLQRRLDAANGSGTSAAASSAGGGVAKGGGGGGGGTVAEAQLRETELALEAAVAEAAETRRSIDLVEAELSASKDEISRLDAEISRSRRRELDFQAEVRAAEAKGAEALKRAEEAAQLMVSRLSRQLADKEKAEMATLSKLDTARRALARAPVTRCAAKAVAAVAARVPAEYQRARATQLRLGLLFARAALEAAAREAADTRDVLRQRGAAAAAAAAATRGALAAAEAKYVELKERCDAAEFSLEEEAGEVTMLRKELASAQQHGSSAKEQAARYAEEMAKVAAERDDALKRLEDKEVVQQTLGAAAGEGAEALTAQLRALRGAQANEVQSVLEELERERKRHETLDTALRAEMATERTQMEAMLKAMRAEVEDTRRAADESCKIARDEVTAVLAAQAAAAEEAAAARAALESRVQAAEAAMAAAQEEAAAGRLEGRAQSEGDVRAAEAKLAALHEEVAAAKERSALREAAAEKLEQRAKAAVAKAEAVAAASVAAAEARAADALAEAKGTRDKLSSLEARCLNLEAEVAAERMLGGGGGGGGGGNGNGNGGAAAALEMLRAVQSERDALRSELADQKARAASKVDELRRRAATSDADGQSAQKELQAAEARAAEEEAGRRRAERAIEALKSEAAVAARASERAIEQLQVKLMGSERKTHGESAKVSEELAMLRKQLRDREAILGDEVAAARKAAQQAQADASSQLATADAEQREALQRYRLAAERAQASAEEEVGKRKGLEVALATLESTLAAERAHFEERMKAVTRRLDTTSTDSSGREAALATRVRQMEAALSAAAAQADEAYKREASHKELIKQLQQKATQAAATALQAGKRGGNGGGEMFAAMAQLQGHSESLQTELNATMRALEMARAELGTARQNQQAAVQQALAEGENERAAAERAARQAKHELALSQQAAAEVRMQADLLRKRLDSQLSHERSRAEGREGALAAQREELLQQLQHERATLAQVRRDGSAALQNMQNEVALARKAVSQKEADTAIAQTARWAAQQSALQNQQRVSSLEKRISDLETELKQSRQAQAAAEHAAAVARAAGAGMGVKSGSGGSSGSSDPLGLGLGTLSTPSTPGASSRPPPRLPSQPDSKPKPKPPSYPRPATLPDYKATLAIGSSSYGSKPKMASSPFRSFPVRPPPKAESLEKTSGPAAVVKRIGRSLSFGFGLKTKKKSERKNDEGLLERRGDEGDESDEERAVEEDVEGAEDEKGTARLNKGRRTSDDADEGARKPLPRSKSFGLPGIRRMFSPAVQKKGSLMNDD